MMNLARASQSPSNNSIGGGIAALAPSPAPKTGGDHAPALAVISADLATVVAASTSLPRRPLARGNVYRYKGFRRNGFKVTGVAFRGHAEDDGGAEGVGVKWLNKSGGSFWYVFANEEAFWANVLFFNACDPEYA